VIQCSGFWFKSIPTFGRSAIFFVGLFSSPFVKERCFETQLLEALRRNSGCSYLLPDKRQPIRDRAYCRYGSFVPPASQHEAQGCRVPVCQGPCGAQRQLGYGCCALIRIPLCQPGQASKLIACKGNPSIRTPQSYSVTFLRATLPGSKRQPTEDPSQRFHVLFTHFPV
jgi:hypothetical protein